MIMLSLVSLLVGVALGQHFKIKVLIPAGTIGLLFTVGTGTALALPMWSIVLLAVIAWIAMQVGYFIGIIIHHYRSARLSSRSSSLATHAASAGR